MTAFIAMKTLGRNADNDLYLEGGHLAILHDADAQCAIIESILQTQQGELQFDPDRGIDYFGTVLQSPRYIDFWARQVRSRIMELDFVGAIQDFTYRFDAASSTLFWSMTVVNTSDERLDLTNKKTVITGSPGIDVSWNDIYDKPKGAIEALDMVEAMHEEAVDARTPLSNASTLKDAKNLFNRLVYDPTDPSYAISRSISFTLDGVPLGTVIDFKRLRIDLENTGDDREAYYAPFILEIDDGTKLKSSTTITPSEIGNRVLFPIAGGGTTTSHTLMKSGRITITIRGNITKVWSAKDENGVDVEDGELPILLNSEGQAFPYLMQFFVGNRVPLATVGKGAFRDFINLEGVEWKNPNVQSVTFDEYAFAGCKKLLNLTWLPSSLETIGSGCFKECSSITTLEGLEDKPLPSIPPHCFEDCTSLKELTYLPSSITALGERAFAGCSTLSSIDKMPNTIKSIGDECFSGCSGIKAILYLPNALTTIGAGAFSGCSGLVSCHLPEGITAISEGAFFGCSSLSDVMSELASPTIASGDIFNQDANVLTIYVPHDSIVAYQADSHWNVYPIYAFGEYRFTLTNVNAGLSLLNSTSILTSDSIWTIRYTTDGEDQRFTKDTQNLPSYSYQSVPSDGGIEGTAIVLIKGYVRSMAGASSMAYPFLASQAGASFSNLTKIEFALDAPFEQIGDYAFASCTNLSEISLGLPDSTDHEYSLGVQSFMGCTALKTISWAKSKLMLLGDGCFRNSGIENLDCNFDNITSLPTYCFANTGIISLAGIGTGISSLGAYCFSGCTKLIRIDDLGSTAIKSLPAYCFADCSVLSSIAGISLIETLGEHVFENCRALASIGQVNNEYITELPPFAFAGCEGLQTLDGITNAIVALGNNCFSGCTGLDDISAISLATAIKEIPTNCFAGCSSLKTLIGCANILTIGNGAFANCSGLISTSGLGTAINDIESRAFQNCTSLQYASCIASTVPTLASDAFTGVAMGNLTLYVLESMVDAFSSDSNWAAFGKIASRTIKINIENISEIASEDAALTYIESDIDKGVGVSVPGVWYVDYGDGKGFQTYCAADTTAWGNGKTSIAPYTYYYQDSEGTPQERIGTYQITLFGDITSIRGYSTPPTEGAPYPCFLGSTLANNVDTISINSDFLEEIGDYCFYNYGLTASGNNEAYLSVMLNMALNGAIGAYAFAKTDSTKDNGKIGTIETCTATTIGVHAFEYAGLDSSLCFSNVVEAGDYSFAYNTELDEITGFTALTAIAEGMFKGCSSLTSTKGISAATSIGKDGFYGCASLTSVRDLGGDLSQIGDSAFADCPNIESIFVARTEPPDLEDNGFDVWDTAIVYVPAGQEETYETTYPWSRFAGRIRVRSIDFTLVGISRGDRINAGMGIVNASGTWTISYGEGESSYSFPPGKTILPAYTFQSGNSTEKVVKISGPIIGISSSSSAYPIFGQSIGKNPWLKSVESSSAMETTEFGDYVFAGCTRLESIRNVPSIISIGESACANDTALADLSGLSNVASIEQNAFTGCSALTSLYGLSAVTTIGASAFNGCSNLRKIDGLGTGISSIGDNAFASCPLSEVQMFAETPPTISSTTFTGIDGAKVPLYVRTKSISAYSSSSAWNSLFSNIRSRFVEFTLTACPANTTIIGDTGNVESDTLWVADWDPYESNTVPCKVGMTTKLPPHIYTTSGNHTIRLEGAITGISGQIDSGYIFPTPNAPTVALDILGTTFMELQDSNGVRLNGASNLLTRVFRSEYSQLQTVGDIAFYNNPKLATADLSGIVTIGRAAFALDTGLTSLSMLDNAETIDKYAFYGCTGLTSITGLNGYTNGGLQEASFTIGDMAFGGIVDNEGKPLIQYVQVGVQDVSKASITDTSFGYFSVEADKKQITIYVPMSSIGAYNTDSAWKLFKISSQVISFVMENVPTGTTILGTVERIESDSRWTIDWDDGITDTMEKNATAFPAHTYTYNPEADEIERAKWIEINGQMCRRKVEILITGTIRSLSCKSQSQSSFLTLEEGKGNPYLKKVTAPESMNSLQTLGDYFLMGCTSLESITGFSNVKAIGQYAFQGCTSLTDIGGVSAGFKLVTSIGNKAFADCTSLQSLASFASVLTIGIRAFENCISLNGTTGMGSAYNEWGINQKYSTTYDYNIGDNISSEEWFDSEKNSYSPTDIEKDGWKRLVIGYNSNGFVTSIGWVQKTFASFGAYAFEGCGFGAIDMENYAWPPSIQSSTFPGDPSNTLVFVSPNEGAEAAYKTAPIWIRYFNNIIAASSLSFSLAEGIIPAPIVEEDEVEITDAEGNVIEDADGNALTKTISVTRGRAIYGANGLLDFVGSYVIIDWGDGTTTTKVAENSDGLRDWTFPNHLYTSGVAGGPVTIKIRGDINKIYVNNNGIKDNFATDTPLDEGIKPFLALANFTTTYDSTSEEVSPVTTIDTDNLIYNFKFGFSIGNNSKLTRIGTYCFQGCNINQLSFGKIADNSKLTIGACAFRKCSDSNLNPSLTNDALNNAGCIGSVESYAFAECSNLDTISFLYGATSIANNAFENDYLIENTDGLDAVETIGVKAFYGCTNLQYIHLPQTLKSISTSAFEGCSKISLRGIVWDQTTDAEMLNNAENINIGARAFYGCKGENASWAVSLPSQVHSIGNSAFYGCQGMSSFSWGSSNPAYESAGAYGFANTDLAEGEPGIFEGCSGLQQVLMPESITEIPERAFCNCVKLESINAIHIDDINASTDNHAFNISTIKPYAFFSCERLSNESFATIIENASGSIGNYAFARCFYLTDITIPSSVTSLGEGCFSRSDYKFMTGNYLNDDSSTANSGEADSVPTFYGLNDFETWMANTYGRRRMDVWGVYDSIIFPENPNPSSTNFRVSWLASNGYMGAGCFMNCPQLDIDWTTFPSIGQIPDYCFYNCQMLFSKNQYQNLSELPSTISRLGRFSLARTGMRRLGRLVEFDDEGQPVYAPPLSASLAPALFLGCSQLETLGDEFIITDADSGDSTDGSTDDNPIYVDGLASLFSTIPSALPDACFYGCSALENINALAVDLKSIRRLGKYCFAKCIGLSCNGERDISTALASISEIGDGTFMACTGLSGIFKGLPYVTYYPYLAFYGCYNITQISGLCLPEIGNQSASVILEGNSFGDIPNLQFIALPYSNKIVEIVAAGTSTDPFSGIPDKSEVIVYVPHDILESYLSDSYWSQFVVTTSYDDLVSAIEIKMMVPNGENPAERTIYGHGNVTVFDSSKSKVVIDWGDDSEVVEIGKADLTNGVTASLSGLVHTYAQQGDAPKREITLTIKGDVISFNGEADNNTSSKLDNRIVVPIFYTKVLASSSDNKILRAENPWVVGVSFAYHMLKTIGSGSFGYYTALKSVDTMPNTVREIGNNAFFGCEGLENLNFLSSGITKLGSFCFAYCTGINDFTRFASCTKVTSIPAGCFAMPKSIPTSNKLDWLPPSITSIEFGAFQHFCFSRFNLPLTKSDGSPNPITIGNYAFRYNNSLLDFYSDETETTSGILLNLSGTNAFRECKGLTSLKGLQITTSYVNTGTFRQCENITDISDLANAFVSLSSGTIAGITEIRDGAFYGTAITSLTGLPNTLTRIGSMPEPQYSEPFEKDIGGAFANCTRLASLAGMPSSVEGVGTAAFKGCTALTRLTNISSNIASLGEYCFAGSGLTDLDYIPHGLSTLGVHCFEGCASLKDVSALGQLGNITHIPDFCFANCISLKYIGKTNNNGTTYEVLNENLMVIGQYAFSGCIGLESIILGRWVPSLDKDKDKITDLEDTETAPNCFSYSTLSNKANFSIYVPNDSETVYGTVWCAENLFGSRNAQTGTWEPFSLTTY